MSDHALLVSLISLPFIGSLIAATLRANARNAEAWLSGAVALACLALAAAAFPAVAENGIIRTEMDWIPALGIHFTLRLDGFAWLFTVLIAGIGLLVVLYARYYMSPEDPVPRFFSFLLAFMGAMQGIVLAGDLILLVVFWELTSIFSFLLIGYWHHNAHARDGARMALTVTGAGGLALLVGMVLIGQIVGSYDLDDVLASGDLIRSHDLYLPALILVLLGALTKSAQFPFQFWLPGAMAAPTPVSAYLHSATMVKAGVFLLTRFWPVLSGTQEWFVIVGVAGMASLLLGAFFAIFQQDIKGLLAYSTISHLGLITMLLSLGSPLGAVAAIFHMLNHATFKASLFMAAGVIDHETGTRDMRRLQGLLRYIPVTATLAMVASAAMAGVPLLNGFLSKEMFFAEAIEKHAESLLDTAAPYVAVVASAFSVTYSLRFIHSVFLGPPPQDLPREPHEPPFWMGFPILILVLICLLVGVAPALTIGPFLHSGVVAVLGPATPQYSLKVWHGLNLPMAMSLSALVAGLLLYLVLKDPVEASPHEGPPVFRRFEGRRIFERVLVTVSWRWARFLEDLLSTRRLQPQLRVLIAVAVLAGVAPLAVSGRLPGLPPVGGTPDLSLVLVWTAGMCCALAAALQAKFHRLAALILMGGAGLASCVTFVWFSAPDLALTQLVVEIVTTVLILLGLRWLPKRQPVVYTTTPPAGTLLRRGLDLLIAVAAGVAMAAGCFAVLSSEPLPDTIAGFFLEHSYAGGGGHNVVNVILVDFRAFDTLGEITVLAIVALSVFALLRRFRPAVDSLPPPEQQLVQDEVERSAPDREAGDTMRSYLLVPAAIMQWLFPVAIVLAAHLFLRGHDLPGGGFAAGVTMAAAFILQYMAGGTRWVEDRLRILPVTWIGLGLIIAGGTGVGAWLFGYPLLTSYFRYLDLPLVGESPLATALLFDLGVFTLVVGATVLMLVAIAHQSLRHRRQAPPDTPEPA